MEKLPVLNIESAYKGRSWSCGKTSITPMSDDCPKKMEKMYVQLVN